MICSGRCAASLDSRASARDRSPSFARSLSFGTAIAKAPCLGDADPFSFASLEGQDDLTFRKGPYVASHVSLGEGMVQRVTSDSVTVLFEDSGYKTSTWR